MSTRLVVKGRFEDIALLSACYVRLGLDWVVEPWADRRTCVRERAVGDEGLRRLRGAGRALPGRRKRFP